MSGKRNVSVFRGHELANALAYILVVVEATISDKVEQVVRTCVYGAH